MSKIKQLLGEAFVYGLSSVLGRFLNFLLLPIYTRILSPDDYGVLNIINTTFSIIWLLAVMALDSSAFVYFHDRTDNKFRKSIFSSWFWSQLLVASFFAILLYYCSGLLSNGFFGTRNYSYEFRLVSILLLVNLLPNIIWNWFRSFRKVRPTAIFTLVQSLTIIGLNILFIAVLRWGIKGFFWAQIISGALMTGVSFFFLKDWISLKYFDKIILRKMLSYSLPLVPTAVALWGLNSAGGYFLQGYKGETEVGLYQTGVTIAGMMTFVIGAFTQAWGPFAMSIKDESGSREFYAKVFILYLSVVGLLAAGVAVFAPEIVKMITAPAYKEAHWVASILAFSSLLLGLNYIGSLGMSLVKNMRPFAKAFIIGAVINLFLYVAGSKYLGKEGCALASLVTNTGITIYIFVAAQRMMFIPYDFKKGWMIGLACLCVALVGKGLIFSSLWDAILVKLGLCALLLLTLVIINKSEISVFLLRMKVNNKTKD